MFEEMKQITLSGNAYPMKCDNLVLEKIQDKYGDLTDYENKLSGFIPKVDENGEKVRNEEGYLIGRYEIPKLKILNEALVWFVQEGLEIEREELNREHPKVNDRTLIRQIDMTPAELGKILHEEFARCFERKNVETTQRKAEEQENPKK